MRIPLGIKITLGTVSAVLVAVCFLLISTYNYLLIEQTEELKQKVHIDISRLQQTIEFLLQKNEFEQAQVEMSSLGSIKHMNHAFLVDDNNEVIASSQLAFIGRDVSEAFVKYTGDKSLSKFSVNSINEKHKMWISDDGETLFAAYPVVLGLKSGGKLIESKVGFIGANIDLRWVSLNALETLQAKTIPVVLVIIIMAVLFSVFYNHLLVRRINNINSAAKRFSSSGYKSRADVNGNDELSDLGSAFNEMAMKVEKQSVEIIKNEENISLIINSMEDGVITIDDRGIIRSFNKSAEKMFGYRNDEIAGKNVNVLMPEPYQSTHDAILHQYVTTGEKHIIGYGRDLPALHKDGSVFSIHLSVNELPQNASGERLFIGSCLDITLLKEQEQQLRHSQKMDALGKLTGGIAHDYNNMLGVILGYSELLIDKLSGDPKLKKYITEIHHAGQRGAKLTQKLLAFSRQKTSSSDVTNINILLENNRNMLEKTLTARIQLIYELGVDLWPVQLDKGDLEDAVLNMCINSMHAIEHSGRLILSTKNCELSKKDIENLNLEREPGDYICLNVCDTGAGINEDTVMRIFDPFYTTKGDRGNGLGLSQVYGFVNRSMGSIKVESEIGVGSCFTLYFPRYVGEKASQDRMLKSSDSVEGSETILVVDDEPSLRSLLNEMLTSHGYSVVLAERAEQAIEILKKHHVDLVLSDVIMPGMNGYKLAEYITEHYPGIKVQLASGYSDNTHNSEQRELHNNILNKPFERNKLLTRLRQVFDEQKGRTRNADQDIKQILTGIESIDNEHIEIISMVAECSKLAENSGETERLDVLVDDLLVYVQKHFRREEDLLNQCGHSNIKQYKSTHDFLIKALRKNYNQYKQSAILRTDLKNFLNEWLHDHISGLDTNMLKPLCSSKDETIRLVLSEFEEKSKGKV